jgi:protoporphyrinogen oxidase
VLSAHQGSSLTTAVLHFFKKAFAKPKEDGIQQKGTETSLIEKFLYPQYGPGQLWEHAADRIREKGGEILLGWRVTRLYLEEERVTTVEAASNSGRSARSVRACNTATPSASAFYWIGSKCLKQTGAP